MPTIKTDLEAKLYASLKRITAYAWPDELHRTAERDYGLPAAEVIEMAYENVLVEAKAATKGIRLPRKPKAAAIGAAQGGERG